jgi:hypothetical protein
MGISFKIDQVYFILYTQFHNYLLCPLFPLENVNMRKVRVYRIGELILIFLSVS